MMNLELVRLSLYAVHLLNNLFADAFYERRYDMKATTTGLSFGDLVSSVEKKLDKYGLKIAYPKTDWYLSTVFEHVYSSTPIVSWQHNFVGLCLICLRTNCFPIVRPILGECFVANFLANMPRFYIYSVLIDAPYCVWCMDKKECPYGYYKSDVAFTCCTVHHTVLDNKVHKIVNGDDEGGEYAYQIGNARWRCPK